jgi:hypothetical protein
LNKGSPCIPRPHVAPIQQDVATLHQAGTDLGQRIGIARQRGVGELTRPQLHPAGAAVADDVNGLQAAQAHQRLSDLLDAVLAAVDLKPQAACRQGRGGVAPTADLRVEEENLQCSAHSIHHGSCRRGLSKSTGARLGEGRSGAGHPSKGC